MPRIRKDKPKTRYAGFERPEANYFRMPNAWIDLTAEIDNLAELKVVQYILRHTWGYQEYDLKKHITVDEFVAGRKRQDGTRLDKGTGLSERAVRYGLGSALEHGLIEEEVDDSDRGRIKKSYSLKMRDGQVEQDDPAAPRQDLPPGVQSLHPDLQGLLPRGAKATPRTEKDTQRKTLRERHLDSKDRLKQERKDRSNRGEVWRGGVAPGSELAGGPRASSQPTAIGQILAGYSKPKVNRQTTGPKHTSQSSENARKSASNPPVGSQDQPTPTRPSRGPGGPEHRARRPKHPEWVLGMMEWFADELHDDPALLNSVVTRATNLWTGSGLSEEAFRMLMFNARTRAKQRGNIQKPAHDNPYRRNRVPYFFAVLESMLAELKAEQVGGRSP